VADAATSYESNSYDAVPTPIPLNYANMRRWRANNNNTTAEPQYSVPVRWADCDAVYDNQETFDRRRRCAVHTQRRPKQLPATSSAGDARIMRFVELRQVRAADVDEALRDGGQQRSFRPHAAEDRYLVAPTVSERSTPSRHLYYQRASNESDAVYVNADSAPSSQRTPPDPVPQEDTEHSSGPGATSEQEEHAEEFCKASDEEEERLDEDRDAGRSAVKADYCENAAAEATKVDELQETGSRTTEMKSETRSDDSWSCREQTQSDATPARLQFRLKDAYLLRMSPPPPSHQTDGRRRAAYSDPVRWVSPLSTERPGGQQGKITPPPPPPRQATTSGRPNGFRAGSEPSGAVGRTAAMTCTNEALDEAIRRRNRKCKPSAMRRLQAAKAVGEPETPAAVTSSSSFEPIFEGVSCSLRTRSASLTDCNALAKERGRVLLNF